MRRHALTMGAAVLAAVPVVISPLPASAVSPMTPSEWMDYYSISSTDAIVQTLWTSDEFWPIYFTAVMNIIQMPYINGVPINPVDYGGGDTVSGVYLRDGVKHSGSITYWGTRSYQNGSSAHVPFFVGDDCSVYVDVSPQFPFPDLGSFTCTMYYETAGDRPIIRCDLDGTGSATVAITGAGFNPNSVSKDWKKGSPITIIGGVVSSYAPTEMPVDIREAANIESGGTSQILGQLVTMPDLPTSTLYPEITQDNAMDYIQEVLNPWAVEQSPNIAPYLLQDAPPPPEYPVQETWSNEADWPAGNLLPTIPAASYTVEIPQMMTEGAAFWWRCLGILFDGLGITAIVVGLLALGIVLYFVLR